MLEFFEAKRNLIGKMAVGTCLTLLIGGCVPSALTTNDICATVRNQTFRSVKQYEGGLTINGVGMRHYTLFFKDGTFDWSYSDTGDNGTYTCSNGVLQAKHSYGSLTATYEASRKILIWDGVEYQLVK